MVPNLKKGVYMLHEEQHTICAACLQDKPTPLRIDRMGGYVCLTCVDKQIEELYIRAELAKEAENMTKDIFWEIYPKFLELGGDPKLTIISKPNMQEQIENLKDTLQPFAQFGEWNVDPEHVYWLSTTQGERVCDWFGPSDFNNARKAINQ